MNHNTWRAQLQYLAIVSGTMGPLSNIRQNNQGEERVGVRGFGPATSTCRVMGPIPGISPLGIYYDSSKGIFFSSQSTRD